MHRDEGDPAGARPFYKRALAIREKVLGLEHPDTARSLNNLGCVHRAGARAYCERALAILEKALGHEHPDTRIVRGNLDALREPAPAAARKTKRRPTPQPATPTPPPRRTK